MKRTSLSNGSWSVLGTMRSVTAEASPRLRDVPGTASCLGVLAKAVSVLRHHTGTEGRWSAAVKAHTE